MILLISTTTSASIIRMISVKPDWKTIVCKQLENGGRSFYQKNYKDQEFTIAVTTSAVAPYEIYIDSNFVASCRFVSVDY